MVPSFLKSTVEGSRPIQLKFADVANTDIRSTASFFYDPPGSALKSTQQLNVDWSRFDRHTFFSSAEAKVNVAFDQIVNGYPFDGTRAEVEEFLGRLTGYERWLFDQFPRYRGALHFSGSAVNEDTDGTTGTRIVVKDLAGAAFPDIARKKTGESVLDPGESSLSLEMQLYLPSAPNDVQIVCQKVSSQTGFILHLTQSASTASVDAVFTVMSGSARMSAAAPLSKGAYNHICAVFDRSSELPRVSMHLDSKLVQESTMAWELGPIEMPGSDFLIGSGSAFGLPGAIVTPKQTLSGTIDELRVFHSARSIAQQSQYARKSIFAAPDVRLYFRFNEPPPPLAPGGGSVDSIVLDSSGNSLHSYVAGFTGSLRCDAQTDRLNPMTYERADFAPVLFPAHPGVLALNSTLLMSASQYDAVNPNLITRLIPQHYFVEGQANDGLDSQQGSLNDPYGGESIPGSGIKGGTQYILSFLYVWARFFDEMKLFVDAFSTLHTVGYDSIDTVPDNFLEKLVKRQGFTLPPLFSDASIEQYIDAENIEPYISTNSMSLKSVRNQLLRRVMTVLPDVVRSKGTQHSIKSFLRAVGIDPDNSIRIREHGGPTARQLTYAREKKRSIISMVPFATGAFVQSAPLSGSRLEVGFPEPEGAMINVGHHPPHGISNSANDGLLTSGSWTLESTVQWTPVQLKSMTSTTQSLARLMVSGTATLPGGGVLANLLAYSGTLASERRLALLVRPGMDPVASPALRLEVPAELFDSSRWSVAFGCQRNDEIKSIASSSYFLRAARMEDGRIVDLFATSSFFAEEFNGEGNAFRRLNSGSNQLGSYLQLGSASISLSMNGLHLNSTNVFGGEGVSTNFNGQASDLRFWSRNISLDEWREHVRNPRSAGVKDPLVGYNFCTTRSGSFGRLRVDALNQRSTDVDQNGRIVFHDVSLNERPLLGSGFAPGSQPHVPQLVDHSTISPYFDEAATDEKVRLRGIALPDPEMPLAGAAPVYEVPRNEEPTDDTRFTIEFSLVDALNRDIVTMFSSLDAFDSALGNPELAFSDDYPDLARMRELYFNRLTGRLNFKAFAEFFRWFDGSIGTFIEQLVPRKTRFKGTNFVVESHMLERAKITYRTADMYLKGETRTRIAGSILQPDLVGSVGRF